ncbi:hypothetical protein [Methylobacterium sp. ID0610]|uniref:hypothetical protein n=1 Tax=Methylobacterium carpenticola TaxID=3344827 RepID=UPI00367FA748
MRHLAGGMLLAALGSQAATARAAEGRLSVAAGGNEPGRLSNVALNRHVGDISAAVENRFQGTIGFFEASFAL